MIFILKDNFTEGPPSGLLMLSQNKCGPMLRETSCGSLAHGGSTVLICCGNGRTTFLHGSQRSWQAGLGGLKKPLGFVRVLRLGYLLGSVLNSFLFLKRSACEHPQCLKVHFLLVH
jgi:hypothetical protein